MILGQNMGIHTLRCPTGRFKLVGTVPVGLAYERADGAPLTDEQVGTVIRCGPGILGDSIRTITYATREDAQRAAIPYGGAR